MNEHVPSEQQNSAYLEKQAQILREKLAGHKLFGKWRGEINWQVLEFLIEHFVGESKNLSQVKDKSSKSAAELSALIRMLATFKLNGNELAFKEMQSALSQEEYHMLGEDISFEKTRPVTVAMFMPEVMLSVLQWIIRDDDLNALRAFIDPDQFDEYYHRRYEIKETTKSLKRLLPSLRPGLHVGRRFWNCDLYAAIFKDVLGSFSTEKRSTQELFEWENTLYPTEARAVKVGPPRQEEILACHNSAVMYVYAQEQSEFLSRFSREKQKMIATWQLHVPAAMFGHRTVTIGVHPEREHEMWKKLLPQYCSAGVNSGIGIIMSPDARYVDHMQKMIARDPEQKEMRAVLRR